MHRAPASAPSALLMATATAALLVARVHSHPSSAIEALNPWLSACDLVQPGITDDLQGICSATTQTTMPLPLTQGPGPPKQPAQKCPPQCRHSSSSIINTHKNNNNDDYNNNNTTSNQCLLYLEESHKDAVCGGGVLVEDRVRQVSSLRLRHCCEHAVLTVLRPRDRHAVLAGGAQCRHHLDALLEIDALAARISCEFTEVLTRYDCGQTYSIVYHCDDCKEAYRRWVCSSLVPHLTKEGGRVRPCRSICQTVEQRCPYMLPGDRAPAYPTQYAGEPTFLCLDPNIPETGKQKERSSHGDEEDCCYAYCGTPGRPPCITCPRGPTNATWDPVQCLPPGPPKPPSGPTGCRGGLLTAPIPSTAVATSSAPPSPSSSTSTWPWRRQKQKQKQKRRRHKNNINHLLNTLISGANLNGDGKQNIKLHKKYYKYENEYEYEYEYDYEYELNELWTNSTSRLLIVVVVAFTLLMLNNDEDTTAVAATIFTLPIELILILILKLILLIPTTLLLKCVQRARTWIQYKNNNKNKNYNKKNNIKTNNHWTISQHTHTRSHHHHHHPPPQYLNQNTPDTTS